MMSVGEASAAFSRPTSSTRQSHKSQLNSGTQTKDVETAGIKWGADTVIKFLEIYNSYEVLWDIYKNKLSNLLPTSFSF